MKNLLDSTRELLLRNSRLWLGEIILDVLARDHQLEFVSRNQAPDKEEIIWICGINNEQSPIGMVDEKPELDPAAIKVLLDYANRYLVFKPGERPKVVDQGRMPTFKRVMSRVEKVTEFAQ